MKKSSVIIATGICLAMASGCQEAGPEVIDVSKHMTGKTPFNIDLNRVDAVFYVAPELDVSRLLVTCPTGPTLTFADYVDIRVRPTGVDFDPALGPLLLANGVLKDEISVDGLDVAVAKVPPCPAVITVCVDDEWDVEHCHQEVSYQWCGGGGGGGGGSEEP